MVAKARTLFLPLAAFCLPVFANVAVAEKPRQGVAGFALASHQGLAVAKPLIEPGIAGCLCDFGGRSRSTAKERDAETGLDYFWARYMSAAQGRFTSADAPFADQDGANPQSWNLYSYTRNNPLRFVDPDGRRVQICITGGQCFDVADDAYPDLSPGNPGVVLPNFNIGRDEISIQNITCGGQNCGTATYINDNPGLTNVLHPIRDFREQVAPLNPRTWLGGAIRGGVKVAMAQQGKQPPKIHAGKQGKHIPGHNNFQTGKSELSHPNPQGLLDRSVGIGRKISDSKEAVDFGETIGTWVGPQGQRVPTTRGIIHYDASGGALIVPANPSGN